MNKNVKLKVLSAGAAISMVPSSFASTFFLDKSLNKNVANDYKTNNEKLINYNPSPTTTPTPNDTYENDNDGYFYIPSEVADNYLNTISYNLDFSTTDEMIAFYAKVFEVNEDIVKNKIYELINANPYAWQYGLAINNISYDTIEQAIARTICNISSNPEEYGLTEDIVRNTDGYELEHFYPEELIYKFSLVIGVNPNLSLAIAYGESGRALNSYNFLNNHNVGGIVGSNGYVHYRNEATGLFKYIIMLHDNYKVNMESGSDKINRMASTYCELPDHWIDLVGSIFRELDNYGYDYSYNTYSYRDRDLVLCYNEYDLDENISRVRN